MWYIAILFAILSTSFVCAQKEEEEVVFLVRLPQYIVDQMDGEQSPIEEYYHPRDVIAKRAMPFNGGMYGKRAVPMPFNGGMYGKRSSGVEPIYAHRRSIPFSGGMYGKRSAGFTSSYAANENQIKRGAMPFSGGMYGRRR